MRTVRAGARVELAPRRALDLWSDTGRWRAFVEGFERVVDLDAGWPAPGAGVVWESRPEGRGRVVERVVEHEPELRLVTEVTEEPLEGGRPRLRGRQTLELVAAGLGVRVEGGGAGDRAPTGDGGAVDAPGATRSSPPAASSAELRLDYELAGGRGSPGAITDLLFVRRALRDALRRTLERFADEAAREAAS